MNQMLTKKEQNKIKSVQKNIRKFRTLKQDWDSYGGLSIRKRAIYRAIRLVEEIDPSELYYVDVCPTAKGGVQFEWRGLGPIIEVLPSGRLYIEICRDDEIRFE